MTAPPAHGTNAAQIEYWNGVAGERWRHRQAAVDTMLDRIGGRAMDAAGIAPGDDVLDVGCGGGASTLEIARRVAPSGSATGIDISGPMLECAVARAAAEPELAVSFERADAETRRFPAESFDIAFSRFGVMFFDNPVAAFSGIRGALRRDGRLAFLCWREVKLIDWAIVAVRAAADHLELPDPPGPENPGPFSMKAPDRLHRILSQAGCAGIAIEPLDADIRMGADIEDAIANLFSIGPVAGPVEAASPAVRERIATDLRDALRRYATDGGVMMPSASWIVTARK